MRDIVLLILVSFFLVGCELPKGIEEQAEDRAEKAFDEGQYELAAEFYTDAILLDGNAGLYVNRANCYSYLEDFERAFADYEEAIEKATQALGDPNHPGLATFYYNRGFAHGRAGNLEKALSDFVETIRLNPEFPLANGSAAWILATAPDDSLRDGELSLKYAKAEAELREKVGASDHDLMAAAYAEKGNFRQAVIHQHQAVEMAGPYEMKLQYAERLALYEDEKPFRPEAEELFR